MEPISTIDKLPNEMILNVFRFLPPAALKIASFVNKQFLLISQDDSLWRSHVDNDFPEESEFDETSHAIYIARKRDDYLRIEDRTFRKLFFLIEEDNLSNVVNFITSCRKKITDLQRFSDGWTNSFIAWVNAHGNQSLKDFLFWRVVAEFSEMKSICVWNWIFIKEKKDWFTQEDQQGWTLFHWALVLGQIPFLELPQMIECSPDLMTGGSRKQSALGLCVRHLSIDGIHYLIKRGANINLPNFKNKTPVDIAAERGNLDFVKLLVSKKGSLFPPLYIEKCHLEDAIEQGWLDLACYYLENFSENISKECIFNAAVVAIEFSEVKFLPLLFSYFTPEPTQLSDLIGRIDYTVEESLMCLQFLVEKGGGVDEVLDPEDNIPLYSAVFYNHVKAVQFLLQKGANVEFVSLNFHDTLIERSVKEQNIEITSLLIEYRAPITIEAINEAWRLDNQELIKILEAQEKRRGE